MSRVKQLNSDNQDLIALAEQADQLQDIKALYDTNGGKVLVSLLLKDVVSTVHQLTNAEPDKRDALCERLKANLGLARLLINAEDNVAALDEQLQDALTE